MIESLISLDDLLLIDSGGAVRRNGEIHAPSGCSGFLTYGPYRSLDGGLYKVKLCIAALEGEVGRFTLDVYSNGAILAEVDFLNISPDVELLFIAPSENLIELRVSGYGTAVTITDLSLVSVSSAELRQPRGQRHSLIGDAILDLIIQPEAGVPNTDLSVSSATELLFGSKSMLKVALPDLNQVSDELERRGVDPILCRAMFEDVGFSEWKGSEASVESLVAFPPVRHAFQSQILQEGHLRLICPVTGVQVEAESSLPMVAADHLPIVYEFLAGPSPIIVFANAGWGGAISFIWLVRQDVFLIDNRNWCIGFDGPGLVAQYLQMCVQYREKLQAYRIAPKTIAVASGYQPNLGHFYWNDVSGLEREYRLGRLSRAERLYHRPKLWSGVADLFPDLADRVETVEATQLLSTVIDERRFVVRLTASAVDAGLAERVRLAAEKRLLIDDSSRLESTRQLLTRSGTFRLFLNLRAHNKAWKQQVEGLSQIIERLMGRSPALIVYLDGMPDCNVAADALTERFAGRCTLVNGLNVSFSETLLWCFGCDAFVAVIGSGLVPLTWLADRPGVGHSNTGHHDQIESFWKRVRRCESHLYVPDIDQIEDEGAGIYANYNIDPCVIENLFEKIIDDVDRASRTSGKYFGVISKIRNTIYRGSNVAAK